jgi:Fic family protein
VRIALTNYQFEATHPFRDANGFLGRMLTSLPPEEYGLLPHPLLSLSAYFESLTQAYCDLLLGVTQRGAWEDSGRFFLDGVAIQAAATAATAQKRRDLRNEWREEVSRARASADLLRVIDALRHAVRQCGRRPATPHRDGGSCAQQCGQAREGPHLGPRGHVELSPIVSSDRGHADPDRGP